MAARAKVQLASNKQAKAQQISGKRPKVMKPQEDPAPEPESSEGPEASDPEQAVVPSNSADQAATNAEAPKRKRPPLCDVSNTQAEGKACDKRIGLKAEGTKVAAKTAGAKSE